MAGGEGERRSVGLGFQFQAEVSQLSHPKMVGTVTVRTGSPRAREGDPSTLVRYDRGEGARRREGRGRDDLQGGRQGRRSV